MLDCRYKLDQIGVRSHKLEGAEEKKRVIYNNLADWIGTSRRLDEAPSD
jgi:hypothetical protein